MILELDCGNSFIKWRVLDASTLLVVGEGVVDSDIALLQGLSALKGLALRFCRLVSVRTAEETGELIVYRWSVLLPLARCQAFVMVMRSSSVWGLIAGLRCWVDFIWLRVRALYLILARLLPLILLPGMGSISGGLSVRECP